MMKPNRKNRAIISLDQTKQPGFTLIEIIIAMFILLVGFLAVAKMQVMAISTNSLARDITNSTYFAQSRIDELLALPKVDPDDPPNPPLELEATNGLYVEDIPLEDSRFKMYRRVTDVPFGALTFKKIDIKVEWGMSFWKKKTVITVGR